MKLRQVTVSVCSRDLCDLWDRCAYLTLISFFFIAFIWSHRFSDMSGCFWGPQHDSQWVLWPHLYCVGYGGTELRYSVSRTRNQHLCTGYQRTHRKSNQLWNCLPTLPSKCLPLFLLFFWSFFGSLFPFIVTAWGREDSHCWQHAHPLCVCFYASECVSVLMWASTPYYSVQGWDCVMCRASAPPVDHEGSAVDLHWHFLWASGRHPVCRLHTATWVGPQECHRHWLCRWHITGGFLCDCNELKSLSGSSYRANRSASELYLYRILCRTQPWQSLHWYWCCT